MAEYGSGARWDVVSSPFPLDMLLHRAVPSLALDRQLVGFGRAVSDGGLAASIHDVVVCSIKEYSFLCDITNETVQSIQILI